MLLFDLLSVFHLLLGSQNTVLSMSEHFNSLNLVFMMLKCSFIHTFYTFLLQAGFMYYLYY